ncbi:MAG: hypothetical protein WCL18_04600 [bacterium]
MEIIPIRHKSPIHQQHGESHDFPTPSLLPMDNAPSLLSIQAPIH